MSVADPAPPEHEPPTCPRCNDRGEIFETSMSDPESADVYDCHECAMGRERIALRRLRDHAGSVGYLPKRCSRIRAHVGEHHFTAPASHDLPEPMRCQSVEPGAVDVAHLVQSEREWWFEHIFSTHVPDGHDLAERDRRAYDRSALQQELGEAGLLPF